MQLGKPFNLYACNQCLLQRMSVAAISCFLYLVFSIFCVFFVSFFVPYVNVFFHILHAFFFLASYVNFVAYIFVLFLHVHLVLVYRPVHF